MNDLDDLLAEIVDETADTDAVEEPVASAATGTQALLRKRLTDRKMAISGKLGARIAAALADLMKRECGHALYGAVVSEERQLPMTPADALTSLIVETTSSEPALELNISQAAARRFVAAILGGTDDDLTALRPQGGIAFSQTDKVGTNRLAELTVKALNHVVPGSADRFRLKTVSEDDGAGWIPTPDDVVIDLKNDDFATEYCEISLTVAGPSLTLFGEKGKQRSRLPEQVAASRMETFAGMIRVRLACRVAEGELTVDQLDGIKPGDTFPIARLPLAVLTVGDAIVGNAVSGSQENKRAICIQGRDEISGGILT
ncbi:hypothetical protein KCG44_09395 [Pacificimonas sp. WHA3]|uniref:Flagellar motor switch protein FliN-like C-terminal domain-containing protein n=1 Tax=Pacificimonas pallii TaxID=2827236 RepID=A0ABS6SGI3_9SPHN|nr:hypothetical protein [Pacificimonas pallii]MBV7256996.1 hypothetical protein [Pacificimonas pallii]